jgi:cytochrome oxidase Cu insertion factor (SCO1/SenC/PrrC family)
MTARLKICMPIWLILTTLVMGLTLGSMSASGAELSLPPPKGLVSNAPPTPIPAFSLATLDGTTMRSADLQGKVVVVRFWATW